MSLLRIHVIIFIRPNHILKLKACDKQLKYIFSNNLTLSYFVSIFLYFLKRSQYGYFYENSKSVSHNKYILSAI
jgi:hypothetical protein